MQSELAVPITWKGTNLGVINLESPRKDAFTLHHERLVTFFGAQAAVAISAAHSFQEALWNRQVQSELWAMAQIGDAYGPMIHRLNSDAGAISAIVSEIRYKYHDLLARDRELAMRLGDIEAKAEKVLEVPSKLKRQLDRVVMFEELNVATLAETVLDRFGNPPAIVVKRHLDPVPNVVGSPQIEEVIENLLINSVEALPGRSGTIVIGTRTWTSTDRAGNTIQSGVEIYVEDTCGGIPLPKRRTLWEIGGAAKTEGRLRHLGFGLWWIKAFVERIGGTVEVEPDTIVDGVRGCRFTVRLPFKFRRGNGHNAFLGKEVKSA
jgi:signal transduction histidine kinase